MPLAPAQMTLAAERGDTVVAAGRRREVPLLPPVCGGLPAHGGVRPAGNPCEHTARRAWVPHAACSLYLAIRRLLQVDVARHIGQCNAQCFQASMKNFSRSSTGLWVATLQGGSGERRAA
jgi:hypothetical protein